jgi:hypothetical protein
MMIMMTLAKGMTWMSQGEGSDEEDTIDDTVVEKFIRTFHIGGYDVEFNNALSLDRDQFVNLPVRPAQASYTKPDDWRERNRIGLSKLILSLRLLSIRCRMTQVSTLICDIMTGTNNLWMVRNPSFGMNQF